METIDLHGYNQKDAYAALSKKIFQLKMSGQLGLIVITGRGKGGKHGVDNGILQHNVPKWLSGVAFKKIVDRVEAIKQNPGAYFVWFK
jgi:DNA-nicking Smr family endonuclease